jgi:hypothetical protein
MVVPSFGPLSHFSRAKRPRHAFPFGIAGDALMRSYAKAIQRAWNRVGWRDPLIRDGIAIFGAIAGTYIVAHYYDLAPKLFQFGMDHAEWEVDDIIFVVFIMSIGFAIYSYRRVSDLSQEMAARRHAELEARKLARHDP